MNKKILIIGILLLPIVYAHPLLHQVVYDPLGPDIGKEWIEIHNPTNTPIDISQYVLYTTRGRIGDVWDVTWNGSTCVLCIIQPFGYMIIGDTDIPYDNFAALRLQNTRGALKLVGNDFEDLLGYGLVEEGYFLETPAPDVAEGASLIRVNTTGNNFIDFIRGSAVFSTTTASGDTYIPGIQISIENAAPIITTATVEENKILLELDDPNGYEDLSHINYLLINTSGTVILNETKLLSCTDSCNIEQSFYTREEANLEVSVFDASGASTNTTLTILPGPILEFTIEGIEPLRGMPGDVIVQNLTITNTGTIPLLLHASANVSAEIIFGGKTLSQEAKIIEELTPGEVAFVPLTVTIPYHTPAGMVTGELRLVAIES